MKNDYIDNRDAEDDARSYEIDRIENSAAMTDTLPTLSSEEVEEIEKEAKEKYPLHPKALGDFSRMHLRRQGYIACSQLERRKTKALKGRIEAMIAGYEKQVKEMAESPVMQFAAAEFEKEAYQIGLCSGTCQRILDIINEQNQQGNEHG